MVFVNLKEEIILRKMKFNLQRFSVYGTSGNDTLKNTTSNAVVYGYGGNDSIYNSANYATISGGDGNDTITKTVMIIFMIITAITSQ